MCNDRNKGGDNIGELKTITKIPVGAVALMGAVLYAILGLISGIISAIGIAIGVSAIQNALPATTALGSGAGLEASAIIGGVVFGFSNGKAHFLA